MQPVSLQASIALAAPVLHEVSVASKVPSAVNLLPKTFTVNINVLHKLKPTISCGADTVLLIVGNAGVTPKDYSQCRNWLYKHVELHLKKQGKVILFCDGDKDKLHRLGKWKEFSALSARPNVYATYSDCVALVDNVSGPIQRSVLWEIGDHADTAVQDESSKRRKPVAIDEVYDDCGDDTSYLVLDGEEYYTTPHDDIIASDSEEDNSLDASFLQVFLEGRTEARQSKPSHSDLESMFCFLQTLPGSSKDLVELFGGDSGTTRLAIRRHLSTGQNFDLTADINLLEGKNVRYLLDYIAQHKPLCIVMGPPCTSFGPWSNINKLRAPEAWAASMAIGLPLAILAAKVATIQMAGNRHFLCENPWASQLWNLQEWQTILRDCRVRTACCDQCQFGLCDKAGVPTQKATAFVASHELLVAPLRRYCSKQHQHSQLAGSLLGESKCHYAQTWPLKLCHAIVDAIIKLKKHVAVTAYPAIASSSTDLCKACKSHARRDDVRHTRIGNCRFPFDVAREWSCKACKLHTHFKPQPHLDHR